MDKNTIIGFLLIGALLLGFSMYNSDDETAKPTAAKTEVPAAKKEAAKVDAPLALAKGDSSLGLDSVRKLIELETLKKDFGLFYEAAKGTQEELMVENDKLKIWFSNKGGYISRVELKGYHTFADRLTKKNDLNLFIKDSSYYQLNFNHINKKFNTRDFYFVSSKTTGNGNVTAVSFKLLAENNPSKFIEFQYLIPAAGYKLDFNINISGLEREISGTDKGLTFEWQQFIPKQEKIISEERKVASVFYYDNEEDEDDYISEGARDEIEDLPASTKWVSLKQQFFSSAFIASKEAIKGGKVSSYFGEDDTTYVKRLKAELPIPMAAAGLTSNNYSLFFGPNEYDELEKLEVNLEDEVNLGWGIFGWVNDYIMKPLFTLFYGWGLSVGICIILLTFAIKMMLFPITYKNFMSSAKMRVIKPELDKLNEQNKNADPLKKQQATMELYKKTGVNPMAGCIPALLQMPILYALYRLFPALMELRQQPFLWAEDLSAYDSIYEFGFEVPIYGDHVSLFTILMAISLFFYTKYTQQMTPSAASTGGGEMQQAIQKQMKIMMNIMPFLMLFFFNNVAAGLTFYYFLANVITIMQAIVIKKYFIDEEAILSKIEEHKQKPVTKSRFQRKLEELQQQQQKKR